MKQWYWSALAGLFSGTLSAMGMGGGGILVIWLTLGANMEQPTAQGINLLLFLPCAVPALFSYTKKHLIRWKTAWIPVLTGFAGALLGVWLASMIDAGLLRKIFGALLLVMALLEFLPHRKSSKKE